MTSHGPRTLVLGQFDGVHRGHRKLIAVAQATGLPVTAVTFDPHPRSILGEEVPQLLSLERRIELLHEAGADEVELVAFTPRLAAQSADSWTQDALLPLGAAEVVVGAGFRFGHKRRGDSALLTRHGLKVTSVPLVPGVSSTRARSLVACGDLAAAAAMLGRPHEIEGRLEPLPDRGPGAAALVNGDAAFALPPRGSYRGRVETGLEVTVRVGDRVLIEGPAATASSGKMRVILPGD